jgi:hypothetical protein
MATSSNLPVTSPPRQKYWWLGVLSAPAAWTFVEGLGYVVSARQCPAGLATNTLQVRVTQLVICAVGLIVSLNGLRIALAEHRALAASAPSGAAIDGRRRFMATSGVLVSVLFIGGIVLFALSALFLDVCERAV